MIHKRWANSLQEVNEISGRIILIRFKGAGGDIAFISMYAPTAESKESEKVQFHDDLARTAESVQECLVYVGGYFSERVYQRSKH